MNAREIIRETIADLVEINREDIRAAVETMDILDMIAEAIDDQLPEAIRHLVEDEIDSAVAEAIDGALS